MDSMSDAGSERGGRRGMDFEAKPRDFGNWERKGPLSPTAPVREGRPLSNEGPGFRRSSPAWGEGRSQDGSRPPRRDLQERVPTAAEMDNAWRSRMKPDQPPSEPSNPPSPAASAAAPAPATRPKLNLQKRTVPESVLSPAASTESKASPFGGARPIDTATREKEVEERRTLAVRNKKEADDKARAEKAEKQRQAKEQAKSEKPAMDPNGRDTTETPQGGKNFEILRRAEGENGMNADQEAEEQGEAGVAQGAEETKAPEVPSDANANANGNAPAGDDEGWSTVGARQRNNRRGPAGRT